MIKHTPRVVLQCRFTVLKHIRVFDRQVFNKNSEPEHFLKYSPNKTRRNRGLTAAVSSSCIIQLRNTSTANCYEERKKKSKLKNEKCVLHRLLNGYQIIEAIVGFWRRQHANTEHLITGHSFESNKTTE